MTQSWKHRNWKSSLVSLFVLGGAIAGTAASAIAQVTTDGTLPSPTIVTLDGTTYQITGGTLSGNGGRNLFHSFGQFDVRNGETANFLNAPTVANIFARVTSRTRSEIDGIIQSQGAANLFLMNPNGILFGPNAQLNIGGSFVATTANAIQFSGQGNFSAVPVAGENPSLLTINPSALLFNQLASQPRHAIEIKSSLAVPENRSLLLVGGNIAPTATATGEISIDGGALRAPGGRVGLSAVGGTGTVGLAFNGNDPGLEPPNGIVRADVRLTNGAQVDVRSGGGGNIAVNAQNLTIADGSFLRAGIAPGQGTVGSQAGDIVVNAAGEVLLTGALSLDDRSSILNSVGDRTAPAQGSGGNVQITANVLRVIDGAEISASTFGRGNPGSIFVQANRVYLEGGKVIDPSNPRTSFATSRIESRVEFGAQGTGKTVSIKTTELLSASGGAYISTSTDGDGDAGIVILEAINSEIKFDGIGLDGISSGAYSQVLPGAGGKGGDIVILQPRLLTLTNGAVINTNTRGRQNAGTIKIVQAGTIVLDGRSSSGSPSGLFAETNGDGDAGALIVAGAGQLIVQNGALATARTSTDGNAGLLSVEAGSVTVEGRGSAIDLDTRSRKSGGGDAGLLSINTRQLTLKNGGQVTAKTFGGGSGGKMQLVVPELITIDGKDSALRFDTSGVGNAIGIIIETGKLVVQNGGEATVKGDVGGNPGTLDITAGSILMTSGGKLTASTLTETGGNITIKLQPEGILQMFDGSKILTSALTSGGGGTITIEAPQGFIISNGIKKDNDVLASAIQGRGGQIRATASGIFNFIQSDVPTPFSDFTAGSEFGPPGVTILDIQDREPEETLPVDIVDPQIAQGCRALRARADEDKFIVTGRGGLPLNPKEALSSDAVQVDLVTRDSENRSSSKDATRSARSAPESIVEAQGWIVDRDGTVVLVAHSPNAPQHLLQPKVDCVEAR